MTDYRADRNYAATLDRNDPLTGIREQFIIPKKSDGKERIYFLGNSLGLEPRSARPAVERILEEWGSLGVEAHSHAAEPWMTYHDRMNEMTAKIVGASSDEVAVMNALTINLHLMLISFYRPTAVRNKIFMESKAFPSDQYAVKSHIALHGYRDSLIELQPRPGEVTIRTEEIEDFLYSEGATVALLLLAGINYYSGQAFKMERITRAAHARGCIVGFDLAHAVGNIELRLHDWNVDFAAWCSYKYLNGGPGAPGGIFVHRNHARRKDILRLAGWWGQNRETRFQMGPDFDPIPAAEGWQVSNHPILQLAALRPALDQFEAIGMRNLREKSERLTGYLEFLLDRLQSDAFTVITPRDPKQRGAQLSLRMHRNGKAVFQALNEAGVSCDWREPDVIRVAPTPMYNRFTEVFDFAEIFSQLIGAKDGLSSRR